MPWLLSPTNAIDNLKIGLYGEPEQSICTWSDNAGSTSHRHAPDRSIKRKQSLNIFPLPIPRSSPDLPVESACRNNLEPADADEDTNPFPRTGEIAIFANFTKFTGSLPPFFFCLFNLLRMVRLLHMELLRETPPTVSKPTT